MSHEVKERDMSGAAQKSVFRCTHATSYYAGLSIVSQPTSASTVSVQHEADELS